MSKPVITLISAAVIAALFPSEVFARNEDSRRAEDAIEVIQVTSNFRQKNIMQVEGSISALGEQQIGRVNARHVEDILNRTANVNFSSGASRGNFIQIRGIGLRSQFVNPVDPSVAIVIDGINYSGLGGAALLFDVEQFELYRGPQGTQFGTDALAGVINIKTTALSSQTQGKVELGYGNYQTYSGGAAVGGALSDNLNVRGAILKQGSDGYITNDFLNRDDTNGRDESSAKLKFQWQASDNWTVDGVAHVIDIDNGYDAFSLDMNRHTLSDEPGHDRQQTNAYGLTPVYHGFDNMTLSMALSHLNSDIEYSYDEDWSFVGIHDWGYSSTDVYLRDRDQYTADLRLVSNGKTLYDERISWVAGVYFNQRDSDLTRQYTWLEQDFVSENEHQDIAIYGQFSLDVDDKTTLTLGGRVQQYNIDYVDNNNVSGDIEDYLYGFHLSLNHQANEQALTYLTFSRSDKAGGVNGQALAKANDITSPVLKAQLLDKQNFEPETLYSAEFGVKGRSKNNDLNIKLAAFYNYRDDAHVKGWITDKAENTLAETFVGFIDNAGSGRGYGIEIETNYRYNDNLDLYYTLGWLRTKIKDYVVINQDSVNLDMNNRLFAHAPKYQFSAGANYFADSGLFAGIEFAGKDEFFFSDSHNESSNSYVVTNVNFGYQGDDWKISLWARNLFDKDYATRGFFFGNDPRDGYEAHNYVQYGEPGVYGLKMELDL